MRVAVIGSRGIGSGYGGIERMLDELCPRLCDLGHEIDVYSRPDVRPEPRPGLSAIETPSIGGKHLENISRSLIATLKATGRYDLLHFHAIGPGILSALTNLAGQPSVVTIHGLDARRDKWGPFARGCLQVAERALVANAGAITVVSKHLRRYFVERHDIRTAFIPNGLPCKHRVAPGALLASHGLAAGRYALFASRLVPEKGAHDLIAAFNTLPATCRLVIAGGSGSAEYSASLRAAADPERVVFVGHQSGHELAELFSNAGLFVLPSYIEGMSMALLEALAYGLPVLASDIPENRAVLGRAGAWFRPKDTAGLAAALSLLLDPDAAPAERALSTPVALADWDLVARQYDTLYRTVLQTSARPALGLMPALPARPA